MLGDVQLGAPFTSSAQRARVISEGWVAENGYCLRCDSDCLKKTKSNSQTKDFVCENCNHGYELKSKRGNFSTRVLDGAYSAMINTIRTGRTPTFLLLEYTPTWTITGFRAIHHSLITEDAIIPRKPLASSAQRAGWTGCNIVLPAIALQGQIPLLEQGYLRPKAIPRASFAKLENLAKLGQSARTWAAIMLRLLERLPKVFSLSDAYKFESELQLLFPENRNVKPKIRQQLQVLRDAGLIRFCGGGTYERRNTESGIT